MDYREIRKFFGSRINTSMAVMVSRLISGEYDPLKYSNVQKWVDQCYNMPSDGELIMEAINQELKGYGVEALRDEGDRPIADYINFGGTYHPTILRDLATGEFILTSWGDWWEEWESQNCKEEEW